VRTELDRNGSSCWIKLYPFTVPNSKSFRQTKKKGAAVSYPAPHLPPFSGAGAGAGVEGVGHRMRSPFRGRDLCMATGGGGDGAQENLGGVGDRTSSDVVASHLLVQALSADPEMLGGPGTVPIVHLEGLLDEEGFHLLRAGL